MLINAYAGFGSRRRPAELPAHARRPWKYLRFQFPHAPKFSVAHIAINFAVVAQSSAQLSVDQDLAILSSGAGAILH
jgi:hypothetical protein